MPATLLNHATPETSATVGTAGTGGTAATAGTGASASAPLTLAEAAPLLRVSRTTVWRLIRRGALAHTRVGEALRVPPAAVAEYLAANTSRTWTRGARGRPAGNARAAAARG